NQIPAPHSAAASCRLYAMRPDSVIESQIAVPYSGRTSGGRWYAESSIGIDQSISRNGSSVVRSDAATSWCERAAVRGRSVVVVIGPPKHLQYPLSRYSYSVNCKDCHDCGSM